MSIIDVDCGSTQIIAEVPEYGIRIDFAALGRLPGYPPPDTCVGRYTPGLPNMPNSAGYGKNGLTRNGGGGSGSGSYASLPGVRTSANYKGPPCYSESTMALLRYW
jgi:hypothetical protein